MIHERISLVFILLLDIAPNFNIYEDICHAQPSSEHFSSYGKYILYPRLRGSFSSGVYISQPIHFARVCSNVDDFNNRNLSLTAKLLKPGDIYHKIRKKHFLNSTTNTQS